MIQTITVPCDFWRARAARLWSALALLIVLTATPCAQARNWRKVWRVSAAVHIGAVAFDAATCVGGVELNPVLGRGRFGARQVAIMSGITAGALLIQHLRGRHRADGDARHRDHAIANFAAAGVHAVIGTRNIAVRGSPR